MGDLSKDDRLAELLAEMLKKQDEHTAGIALLEQSMNRIGAKLDVQTQLLFDLGAAMREHTKHISDLSQRLTDNGTHELRIYQLEQTVYGEGHTPFSPIASPTSGPAGKGTRASKPKSPKPKSKGK